MVLPVGLMASHTLPNGILLTDSVNSSVRLVVWEFEDVINTADNVDTVDDQIFLEVIDIMIVNYLIDLINFRMFR